jgi:hypothetical protein
MSGNTLAQALGALLLAAGLLANLRRRLVLSKVLMFCGVSVGHLGDLVASMGAS